MLHNNNISVPCDVICAYIYTHKSEHGILGPSVSCDIICTHIHVCTHTAYTQV